MTGVGDSPRDLAEYIRDTRRRLVSLERRQNGGNSSSSASWLVTPNKFGAAGNGVTDDTSAINQAIASLPSGGILTLLPGNTYKTSGGHAVRDRIIEAYGSKVLHTGNNICFDFNGGANFSFLPMGIEGLWLVGNTGAAARGVRISNCWGAHLRDVRIDDYTGTDGIGLHMQNTDGFWTEGFQCAGLLLNSNKTGIRMDVSGGTNSFGYTQMRNFAINVPANCTGIDIGGPSNSNIYFYNSVLEGTLWLYESAPTGIRVRSNTNGAQGNRINIMGETQNEAGNAKMVVTSGTGVIGGYGQIDMGWLVDNTAGGGVAVWGTGVTAQDGGADSNGRTWFPAIRNGSGKTPWDGEIGMKQGANWGSVYVGGYGGGPTIFEAYSIPYNTSAKTGSTLRLSIGTNGSIFMSNAGGIPGTPSGGGVLFVDNGALKYKGSSGTVTTIANA